MPTINPQFPNTTKLILEQKFSINCKNLENKASNIVNKLINANNISDFKFNLLLKKLDKAQQENIALIDNQNKILKKI